MWYVIDATSDGTIIGGTHEVLSYAYFLIDEETMKKRYTGEEYQDLVCDTNYDIFEDLSVTYLFIFHYSLACKSVDDASNVIKYFDSLKKENITLQFELDYEFTGDISEQLKAAFKKAGANFSYVLSGNIIMLIN